MMQMREVNVAELDLVQGGNLPLGNAFAPFGQLIGAFFGGLGGIFGGGLPFLNLGAQLGGIFGKLGGFFTGLLL